MYIGQTPTLVLGANVPLIYIINKGHTCPDTKVGACPTFCQGSTPDRGIIHFLALTQSMLAFTNGC